MADKAIILFSGGLDSTLMLALALERNLRCYTLSFQYGQRHAIELSAASNILKHYSNHSITPLVLEINKDLFIGSHLTNKDTLIPQNRSAEQMQNEGTPPTYVPARNTLFLAYATAFAEQIGAKEIHLGCNKSDIACYPDCRPPFIQAFQNVLSFATKQAAEGLPPKLETPLIDWDKKQIAEKAYQLKVPIELTWSCYNPTSEKKACLSCDACILRAEALKDLPLSPQDCI